MTAIENFQRVDVDECQAFLNRGRTLYGPRDADHVTALGYLQRLLYEVSNSRAAIARVRSVEGTALMASQYGQSEHARHFGTVYAGQLGDALDREVSHERHNYPLDRDDQQG